MNKKEKIILLKDVKNVGKKGEIKLVNAGFASNFLLTNGSAILHNDENFRQLEVEKLRALKSEQLKLSNEEDLFSKINNIELLFYLKKEKNKIFGSVGLGEINKELQRRQFPIQDKKKFTDFSAISSEGIHLVNLRINKTLTAILRVTVKATT